LTAPVLALVFFVAVFALATLRGVHLGILMFVAACAVGPTVAGMSLREVVAGFPVGIRFWWPASPGSSASRS
jgi:hypothetical protein